MSRKNSKDNVGLNGQEKQLSRRCLRDVMMHLRASRDTTRMSYTGHVSFFLKSRNEQSGKRFVTSFTVLPQASSARRQG